MQLPLSFPNYDALYFEVKLLKYVTISKNVCTLIITNQYNNKCPKILKYMHLI
jgi:hypothetical protein